MSPGLAVTCRVNWLPTYSGKSRIFISGWLARLFWAFFGSALDCSDFCIARKSRARSDCFSFAMFTASISFFVACDGVGCDGFPLVVAGPASSLPSAAESFLPSPSFSFNISRYCSSLGCRNRHACPAFPHRAVRPIRCKCSSKCCGGSYLRQHFLRKQLVHALLLRGLEFAFCTPAPLHPNQFCTGDTHVDTCTQILIAKARPVVSHPSPDSCYVHTPVESIKAKRKIILL